MVNDLNELPKKYPSLFKNDSFHFECGNGWYELINVLCSIIERRQLRGSVPSDDVQITQIKEKFGGLRFYCHGVDDYCYGMIDFAEKISKRICEECGNPGKLLKTESDWLYTACDEHIRHEGTLSDD
jgi:hypothetical protein